MRSIKRNRTRLVYSALAATAMIAVSSSARADDVVDQAKADTARYSGPQTKWEGPTSAPKPDLDKSIVFLSGDEQNDISHLYGLYMKQAGEKLGWKVTIIDGKGSPTSWLAGMNQAIALKPNGIAMFADAASLKDPIKAGVAQGIKFVGLHAAGLPGPQPDLNLFVNIQEDPREIGKAEAQWAIADSKGKARVVILTHNEYAIAEVKSMATKAAVEKCGGCKVLEYVNSPASEAAQRQPQLTTSWVQRFGLPFYGTSVGDNDWDFAVPVLRAGGVDPSQVKLVGARRQPLGLRSHSQGRAIPGSHRFRADRASSLPGDRRAQSRLSRRAAERLRAASVPRDEREHSFRGRRQEHLHPQQRVQEALSGNLGSRAITGLGGRPAATPAGHCRHCERQRSSPD